MLKCPECGSRMPDNFSVCGFCGKSLAEANLREGFFFALSPFAEASTLRERILDILKENQALLLLVSISLLIASFSKDISDEAFGYGIGGFIAFFSGLLSSMIAGMYRRADPGIAGLFSVLLLVCMILGFVFLFLVGIAYTKTIPMAEVSARVPIQTARILLAVGMFIFIYKGRSFLKREFKPPQIALHGYSLWQAFVLVQTVLYIGYMVVIIVGVGEHSLSWMYEISDKISYASIPPFVVLSFLYGYRKGEKSKKKGDSH